MPRARRQYFCTLSTFAAKNQHADKSYSNVVSIFFSGHSLYPSSLVCLPYCPSQLSPLSALPKQKLCCLRSLTREQPSSGESNGMLLASAQLFFVDRSLVGLGCCSARSSNNNKNNRPDHDHFSRKQELSTAPFLPPSTSPPRICVSLFP